MRVRAVLLTNRAVPIKILPRPERVKSSIPAELAKAQSLRVVESILPEDLEQSKSRAPHLTGVAADSCPTRFSVHGLSHTAY